MTIVQLEYIIALDIHRSFSKAADHCCITQPTLSMQIHTLEEELGVKIFDRSKKPVSPTDVGQAIINQAHVIVEESKRVKAIVDEHHGVLKGVLRIGIIPTVAPYLLPILVQHFSVSYPDIQLQTREMITSRIVEALKQDEIDAGILVTPLEEQHITEIPLYRERMLAYVGNNHHAFHNDEVDIEALDTKGLWLLNEGHCFRDQVLNLCKRAQTKTDKSFVFESGSLETLKRIVERYGGMTVLPELAAAEVQKADQNKLKPFKGVQPVRQVSIVVRKNYHKKAITKALENAIKTVVPDAMQGKAGEVVPVIKE